MKESNKQIIIGILGLIIGWSMRTAQNMNRPSVAPRGPETPEERATRYHEIGMAKKIFFVLFQTLLILLKLTNEVNLPWMWVLVPFFLWLVKWIFLLTAGVIIGIVEGLREIRK
jgi:hypothetical protein